MGYFSVIVGVGGGEALEVFGHVFIGGNTHFTSALVAVGARRKDGVVIVGRGRLTGQQTSWRHRLLPLSPAETHNNCQHQEEQEHGVHLLIQCSVFWVLELSFFTANTHSSHGLRSSHR